MKWSQNDDKENWDELAIKIMKLKSKISRRASNNKQDEVKVKWNHWKDKNQLSNYIKNEKIVWCNDYLHHQWSNYIITKWNQQIVVISKWDDIDFKSINRK